MARLPAMLNPAPPSRDVGLLVLRLGLGLAMALAHGLGKLPPSDGFVLRTAEMGFPAPLLFAWLAALAEFAGGLLVALGLATRPAALLVVSTMAVAFAVSHAGDPFGDRELSFVYGVGFAAIALLGAGRYSVDTALDRRRPVRL